MRNAIVTLYLKGVKKESFVCKIDGRDLLIKANPENKKVRSVNIYFKCVDGKFRKFTKVKIKECDWIELDSKRKLSQCIDPKVKGAEDLNSILNEMVNKCNSLISAKIKLGNSIYVKDLEALFPSDDKVEPIEIPFEKLSFLEFFKLHTSDKNFEKVLGHLNSFNDYYNYNLDWPKIKDKFYASYIHYMTKIYENPTTKEIGLLNSTLARDPRCIKHVCAEAAKIGIKVPIDYLKFKRPKTIKRKKGVLVGRRIAVSEDIIFKLQNFDFYKKEYYPLRTNIDVVVKNIHEVRDEYTFRFYTGLRLSDAQKLLRENIVNGLSEDGTIKVIDFAQQKTLNANVVPLNDECLRIISKYDGKKFTALPRFSTNYYNRICKQMFRLIGMNNKVTITRMKGDKMEVEVKEEWELLTSHSARHSAATHLLNNGADLHDVQKFLGQEDIRSTQAYAEMKQEILNTKILKITNKAKIEDKLKVG